MNRVNRSIVLASVVLSMAATAHDMYFGSSIMFAEHTEDQLVRGMSFTAAEDTLGNQINDYFAVEARAGVGISGDAITESSTYMNLTSSLELDNFYGLYVKSGIALNETFYPYTIARLAHYNYTFEFRDSIYPSTLTYKSSRSDLSLGLGLDIHFNNFTINIEYLNRYDTYDAKMNGISIGFSNIF